MPIRKYLPLQQPQRFSGQGEPFVDGEMLHEMFVKINSAEPSEIGNECKSHETSMTSDAGSRSMLTQPGK